MRSQLAAALQEVEKVNEQREKQKEMVQSVVNQRDMYRTLLAQATPLPGEQSLSPSRTRGPGAASLPGRSGQGPRGAEGLDASLTSEGEGMSVEVEEARKELRELREQFEAYKKEKLKNDSMLQEQLDKMREESSEIKIHNVKIGSKVRTCCTVVISRMLRPPPALKCTCIYYGLLSDPNYPDFILSRLEAWGQLGSSLRQYKYTTVTVTLSQI